MRAKYYALTIRQMNFKKSFVFLLIFFAFILIILYTLNSKIRPAIIKVSENNARNIAIRCTNEAIYENIENIKYENLVKINKDSNGNVTSLSANSMEINKLTTKIIGDIEEKLQENEEGEARMPIAMFFDENITSGYGPKISIKTFPIGDIKGEIKSNFESTGINQTRHSLVFEITTEVKVLAPFISEVEVYKNSIVIAETIIVSDTPSSYYNITGVEQMNKKDTFTLFE